MLMETVIAVALGVAPVGRDGIVQPASDNYANVIGRYSQRVDPNGRIRVSGFDHRTGAPYELTLDPNGEVECTVGDQIVNFHVRDAS